MARKMNLKAIAAAIESPKTPVNLKKGLIKKYGKQLGIHGSFKKGSRDIEIGIPDIKAKNPKITRTQAERYWFADKVWFALSAKERKKILKELESKRYGFSSGISDRKLELKEFEELPQAIRGGIISIIAKKMRKNPGQKWHIKAMEQAQKSRDIYSHPHSEYEKREYNYWEGRADSEMFAARASQTLGLKNPKHKLSIVKYSKLIGKPTSKFTRSDMEQYMRWLEKKQPKKFKHYKSRTEIGDEALKKMGLKNPKYTHDLLQIGRDAGLEGRPLYTFIAYYLQRGFSDDPEYMKEWADRFARGVEYQRSDLQGQALLKKYDPDKYPPKGWKNPCKYKSNRAKFCSERLISPEKFAKKSFRTKVAKEHRLTFGCPKGKYSRGQCRVPVKLQRILHPEGEKKCPVGGREAKNPPLYSEGLTSIAIGTAIGQIGANVGEALYKIGKTAWKKRKQLKNPLSKATARQKKIIPYLDKALQESGIKDITHYSDGANIIYDTSPGYNGIIMITSRGAVYFKGRKVKSLREFESKVKRLKESNPPSKRPVKIYDNILSIEAEKGKDSLWPKEKFRHDFKKIKGKAAIYGMPDGSLVIKGKKRLWKNFNY